MYVYSVNPGHNQYYQRNLERKSAHCKVGTEDPTHCNHVESSRTPSSISDILIELTEMTHNL